MTTHANVWGTRDTMHMHAWADGGGSYAAIVELYDHSAEARVTLISDTVETYAAELYVMPSAVRAFIAREYSLAGDYAGVLYSDLAADYHLPGLTAGHYVIVSHGIAYALRMFTS